MPLSGDWLDFLTATFNHPLVFIGFVILVIAIVGFHSGSFSTGLVGAYGFFAYTAMEIDDSVLNMVFYLSVGLLMLYIGMYLTGYISGDNQQVSGA